MNDKCLVCKTVFKTFPCRIKIGHGKYCSPECRDISRKNKKSYIRTKAIRKKISNSLLGIKNPNFGKEAWNKNKKTPQNIINKIKKARAKQIITPQHIEAIRKAHSTPEMKELHRKVMLRNLQNPIYKETIPEKLIEKELKKINVYYTKQISLPKIKPISCVDFFLPEYNLIIFVDGNYWHKRPQAIGRDKGINIYLKNAGYKVLRFWESDIKNIKKLKQIIRKIYENLGSPI